MSLDGRHSTSSKERLKRPGSNSSLPTMEAPGFASNQAPLAGGLAEASVREPKNYLERRSFQRKIVRSNGAPPPFVPIARPKPVILKLSPASLLFMPKMICSMVLSKKICSILLSK
jgi:hypothetical protein